MKRLLNPAAQKHSAANTAAVPSAVPGKLSRGVDIRLLMLATKFSSNKFSVSVPSSTAMPAPLNSASAEHHVLFDQAVMTSMDGYWPFQAVVHGVPDDT